MWLIDIHGAQLPKISSLTPIDIQHNHDESFSCISCLSGNRPPAIDTIAVKGEPRQFLQILKKLETGAHTSNEIRRRK
jgi:hypothetical protein